MLSLTCCMCKQACGCAGPALLAYDDAVFAHKDFIGLFSFGRGNLTLCCTYFAAVACMFVSFAARLNVRGVVLATLLSPFSVLATRSTEWSKALLVVSCHVCGVVILSLWSDTICCCALGSKKFDPTATGKFGLGFNSTYHLTECPSFVSGEWFVMLDPQKRCALNYTSFIVH